MSDVNTQAAVLLRAAHDLMMERGRCVGDYEDGQGRVCMEGALLTARPKVGPSAFRMAYDALEAVIDDDDLPFFNDDPSTTDDDCFDAFQRAIKHCEEAATAAVGGRGGPDQDNETT